MAPIPEFDGINDENRINGFHARFEPITPITIDIPIQTRIPNEHNGVPKRAPGSRRQGRELFAAVSDMLFSLAIIMIVFMVIAPVTGGGTPRGVFDLYCFTVLTPSMQDEIPQGSFILVKKTDPATLHTGDNVTFMADRYTAVTHKIAGIYENYGGSGARGFMTKGVNNPGADHDVVYAANVVGKVVFVLPKAGNVLSYLSDNVFCAFIIFGLCVLLSFLLRGFVQKPQSRRTARV